MMNPKCAHRGCFDYATCSDLASLLVVARTMVPMCRDQGLLARPASSLSFLQSLVVHTTLDLAEGSPVTLTGRRHTSCLQKRKKDVAQTVGAGI